VRDRLTRVFGIGNFAQAGRGPLDLDALATQILQDLGDRDTPSFRVSARRADKRYPLTSPQIERELAGGIKLARGWTVNLDEPALTSTPSSSPAKSSTRSAGSAGPAACLPA